MQQLKSNTKTYNLKRLADRIKELRLQKSKSLNKFVFSKGNVTSATWSRVENALVDVKFSTLVQMSGMLEMNLSDMVKNLDLDYEGED
ncbi:helix-turn-helix transcriptional regulator [bacterium]|nr:helix-turn-helix transcriptional regulator [bacterium]